jgi:hypothetical protein
MKTRNILLSIGVATLTAITISAIAGDIALSPRAAANQTPTVAGGANDVNPAMNCRHDMAASPKAIQACESNPVMPCCKSTATANAKP